MARFILLLVAVALLGACRSANSVAKEAKATLSAETVQSGVVSDASIAHLMSSFSLQADSITVLMQTEGASIGMDAPASLLHSYNVDSTTVLPHSPSSSLKGGGKRKQIQKVVLSGVRIVGAKEEQLASSSLRRDSVSIKEERDSSLVEKVVEDNTHSHARAYIFIGILLSAVAVLGVRLIAKRFL